MKPRSSVEFLQAETLPNLSSETMSWARNIADVLLSRNDALSSHFVFTAGSLSEVLAPDYDVQEVYRASISYDRKLDPNERLICEALQSIISQERDQDRIREAIGYVAECFQAMKKKRRYGGHNVVHRANLSIHGRLFTHNRRQEIDIAVDRLSGDWAIDMCECTTSARRFEESKIDQIDFYAAAFQQIRKVVPVEVKLRMELVAGYTTRRAFRDVKIPTEFAKSNVKVVGVSLSSGHEYQLNEIKE